ncbi:PREDICTED: tubby-related protein 4-like [Priapulus caudatus]|uniref:Tubby-related protein 4-like n=1 Tax=Priapulus caudatus TaxID=37621 RepID=A0ABM1ETD0_PRICU|nr:PREDICTED: tubby-related protein 4-like [Priapulus caudatus]
MQSPLVSRKGSKSVDSSEEDAASAEDDNVASHNYKNLQKFQKSHIRQKLKKGRRTDPASAAVAPSQQVAPRPSRRREFVMRNKAPLWNEANQVYQLDFGGRVTQESAKNFQVESKAKQVMQFGRIDGNAYTLDFQHPFTAAQAFAVALANVTQRLK